MCMFNFCNGSVRFIDYHPSVDRQKKLTDGSIFVWCDTTDAGPDQAARRRQMQASLAEIPDFYYLDSNCLLHQLHLIVRDQLQLIDGFLKSFKDAHPDLAAGFHAYASNLAKSVNFWRSHVADFIDAWERIHGYGKSSARTRPDPVQYRRFPLSVITGRWGSIESSEAFFVERSRELLEPVYLSVLSKYMKASKDKAKDEGSGKNDADSSSRKRKDVEKSDHDLLDKEEDREAYRLKLTKWAEGALCTVRSNLFWFFLHVSEKVRSPLSHFLAWVQNLLCNYAWIHFFFHW